jgi:DUF2934 family protein
MEAVMSDMEQNIRERAYALWVEGGCKEGQADAHWLAAQREVLAASLGALGHVNIEASPARAKRTASKPRAPRKKRVA